MNERIRELIFEAVTFRLDPDSECYEARICPEDLEYLAELIVQECAEICMKEIDTGLLMAPQAPGIAKQIKQHFGVEE